MLSFILGIDGDRERGIQELNIAVEKGTYVQTEAMFFLGAIYTYREKEYDKGLEIWYDLLNKYPDNPGVLIHLGRCLANQGKCDQAVQIYEKILANKEKAALIPMTSIHYQLGNVQYKLNRFESAISSFEESIRIDTLSSDNRRWTYEWAHLWLAESYEALGQRETAARYYARIREDSNSRAYERAQKRMANPLTDTDIRILMGKNNISCQRFADALDIFFEEREKNSEHKNELTFHIGETLYHMGRYNAAINEFNDLLVAQNLENNLRVWAHYYRGSSFYALGQKERALDDLKKSAEMDDPVMVVKIQRTIESIEKG